MGRELTKRYWSVFETRRLAQPVSFVRDVYAAGKWRELSSFIVWELLHRFRLFPIHAYLTFSDYRPLTLERENLDDRPAFCERVKRHFADQGLRATTCEHDWKLVYLRRDRGMFGCCYPNANELCESDDGRTIKVVHSFPQPIKALFVSSTQTVFVCVKGAVYRRTSNARSFSRVLDLASPESFFRHNNGMTEAADGTLVIGEYGNVWNAGRWKKLAFLYSSSDDGATWTTSDFLIRQGTNKHVHVVKHSNLLNKLLVSDGDNHKKLWVGDTNSIGDGRQPKWTATNRFHIQIGGHTSIVETDGSMFFGTDYQGGTNFILKSADAKTFTRSVIPDPYRRSPIDNMVLRRSRACTEIWANLPYSTAASKSLLMFSRDNGSSWNKVVEYSRATHVVWLISTSSDVAGELYISIENIKSKHRAVFEIGDN
jgi:hypothetical protein